MLRHSLLAASCIASLLGTASAAPIIAYSNADIDTIGSGWRTASVAKTDPLGASVLGRDGWYVAGGAANANGGNLSLPGYINSATFTVSSTYGGWPETTARGSLYCKC